MSFNTIEQDDELALESSINVTPFIDVILVLLIIFMVAAPLATVSVPIDLPSSNSTRKKKPDKPFYLSVKSDLSLRINEEAKITLSQLPKALSVHLKDKNQPIFLRGDKALSYDDLMKIINVLSKAGYAKVALVGLEERDKKP